MRIPIAMPTPQSQRRRRPGDAGPVPARWPAVATAGAGGIEAPSPTSVCVGGSGAVPVAFGSQRGPAGCGGESHAIPSAYRARATRSLRRRRLPGDSGRTSVGVSSWDTSGLPWLGHQNAGSANAIDTSTYRRARRFTSTGLPLLAASAGSRFPWLGRAGRTIVDGEPGFPATQRESREIMQTAVAEPTTTGGTLDEQLTARLLQQPIIVLGTEPDDPTANRPRPHLRLPP